MVRLILVFIVITFLGACSHVDKMGYIEIGKVLDDFQLAKELKSRISIIQQTRAALLDSMELELNILSRQIQSDRSKDKSMIGLFSGKRDFYIIKKKQFTQEIDSLSHLYDEQISTQLNQYVKEFGEKNNYKYIFGAEGSGALMFASSNENITDSVKSFVNQKYLGKGLK